MITVVLASTALLLTPPPRSSQNRQAPYASSRGAELFGGADHCRDSRGRKIACPAATAPAAAIARCRDGSFSMSPSRVDACAANGGVAAWLR